MNEYVLIARNADGDVVGVLAPTDPLNPGYDVDRLASYGLSCERIPVSAVADFEDALRGETCACGQWPVAEYGARCPSCPPEVTS